MIGCSGIKEEILVTSIEVFGDSLNIQAIKSDSITCSRSVGSSGGIDF